MKTSELTGAALDWAVACVEKLPMDLLVWEYGLPVVKRTLLGHTDTMRCEFSTNWAQGGPIIEREGIELLCNTSALQAAAYKDANPDWFACLKFKRADHWHGPTPLIAAMRCYVASKLGDEVEVPDDLH